MIIEKVQRVANPSRKRRKYKAKKRTGNPKRRIKLSAKQIKAGFGGKRRQMAKKAKRRTASRVSNPKRKRKYIAKKRKYVAKKTRMYNPKKKAIKAKRHKRYVARKPNPAILTLGYLNPERRETKMVKKRKYTKRRSTAKKVSNPSKRRYSMKTKNPTRRRHVRRHRNPDFLGNGMEAVGILLGVAIQKLVNGFVPASISSGNAMVGAAISFAVAFAVGKGADMVGKGKPISKGIALGALASAASNAINVFAPSLSGTIGLNGLGTYQNALFAVPENPIMRGLPAPSVPVAAKGMGGALTAAFGNSF